jgi:hypothetical protein
VVAAQRHPRLASGQPHEEVLDHLGAFGSAVHKITQVNHHGFSVARPRAILGDPLVGQNELVELPVDIADGVEAGHRVMSGRESKARLRASPQPWLMVRK